MKDAYNMNIAEEFNLSMIYVPDENMMGGSINMCDWICVNLV